MDSNKKKTNWRKRLFHIIEPSQYSGSTSVYNICLFLVIMISIIPLTADINTKYQVPLDISVTIIFIIDYLLRWITADYKLEKQDKHRGITRSDHRIYFILYPFSHMAIIDLLAILPGILDLNPSFRLLKMLRILRTFRFFKTLRYSKSTAIIMKVFRRQQNSLMAVCFFALEYILVCALIIYNAEPETFHSFFDAIYWATISLTTVGYGDIYPVTTIGRIFAMVSSVFGIAIIAMPAGIITAGFMKELEEQQAKEASSEINMVNDKPSQDLTAETKDK